MTWLAPLRAALDAAPAPVTFFLRDDDAGWGDDRLLALLGVVESFALPLDLAVIPRALTPALARTLLARAAAWDGGLGLHQHGLAHVSHERAGRKCEFGPARSAEDQRRDVATGRALLGERLGDRLEPVFTPPWNRCTATTAGVLAELGFAVLSRDVAARPFAVPGLAEVPVGVDWSYARRDGVRLTRAELGALAAARVRAGGPVGINLHHAVMDDAELAELAALCALLAAHPRAACRPLVTLAYPAGIENVNIRSASIRA